MTETYAKSEAQAPRGSESVKELRTDPHSNQEIGQVGEKTRNKRITLDRKSSKRGTGVKNTVGGIIDQLIEDARKQLGKSRECVVWYQAETKECEEKLENLIKLKELQEQEPEEIDQDDEVSLEE